MQEIDFDQFKIKNPNHRDTFQDLCYHLFCRKHKRNSGIFEYRNQVGIEVEPIKVGKNYVSFQAKFFDNGISYKDITDSIEKAKNKNCNLTKIVFYINLPLSESSKPKVKDSKDKIKVEQKAKNLGIKLDWVVPSNFKSLLNQKGNLDLAQFYFGTGDELGFIGSSCNPSMVTFLQSASHLKLPVKKLPAKKKIEDCILSNATKIFLILGHPGAGKTILIHKLFFDFSGIGKNRFQEMIKVLKKNKALPLLINLKDCVYKNIDNIIKERKDGYNISKDFPGFIYLFDGLDELSTERADRVLAYAASLAKEKQTKKIIISCRSGNQNRYLFGTYFSEFNEFEIDSLKIKFIEKYFSAKKNQAKIKKLNLLKRKNPNILKEIKDVFLTSLLWEVIDRLTFESSIIDLFEYKIKYLLADPRFKKNIEQLNLLDPKKRIISEINQEISFEFQKHFQYRFKRNEIQRTILNKLPRLSYRDVNGIFDYICSLFFMPGKPDPDSGESFIYQHRRYQEFFLVQKLKSEYEKNRKIVRENFLSNRDFFALLFVPYLRSEYEKENNFSGLIELNLIEVYLGNHNAYGADDDYYDNSANFIPSLAIQENKVFERLLADENLCIRKKISSNPSNISLFWREGKKNFAKELLSEFDKNVENAKKSDDKKWIEAVDNTVWSQWEDWLYIKLVIKKYDVDDLFKNLIRGNYKRFKDERRVSYEESRKERLVNSFFRVCIENKSKWLIDNIENFDNYEFISILELLSEINRIPFLKKEKGLQEKIKALITNYNVELNEENYFIIFYKKFLQLDITEKEKRFANEQIVEIQKERRMDLNFRKKHIKFSLLSYALDLNDFPSLLKDPDKQLARYYDELFLFAALFQEAISVIMLQKKVSEIARKFLSYIRTHHRYGGSYLKSEVSSLWSVIFANSKNKIDQLLPIKNLLFDGSEEIIPGSFLKNLRTKNKELFGAITNEQDVEKISQELEEWDDDFPSYVDTCFDLAIFLSTLNQEKAIYYISKGINEGILRHGWRKDIIVSYHLVDALEIVWRNNWLKKDELIEYATKLFNLTLRVSQITDGDGTWRGSYNVLELVSKYDLKLAEKLKEKLYTEKGRHNVNNSALTIIILEKIKMGLSLDEVKDEVGRYRVHNDYENRPFADSYEQKFLVYLSLSLSGFYTDEERRRAFEIAYDQIEEMKKEGLDYYLRDMDFKKEKKTFRDLCKKYNKKYNIPEEKKQERVFSAKPSKEEKYTETDFVREIKSAKTRQKLNGCFRKIGNYRNEIILKKAESWKSLVEKTYELSGNIEPLIKLLKKNNYPHTDFFTANSRYFHFALAACLDNFDTKDEMIVYLKKHSGHEGFLNIMKAYEVNKDKTSCMLLFKRFFDFCDFLVN